MATASLGRSVFTAPPAFTALVTNVDGNTDFRDFGTMVARLGDLYNGQLFESQAAGEKFVQKASHVAFITPKMDARLRGATGYAQAHHAAEYEPPAILTPTLVVAVPGAPAPAPGARELPVDLIQDMIQMALMNAYFLLYNADIATSLTGNNLRQDMSAGMAAFVGWIRTMSFVLGLYGPQVEDIWVNYTEYRLLTGNQVTTIMGAIGGVTGDLFTQDDQAAPAVPAADLQQMLSTVFAFATPDNLPSLIRIVPNLVCAVACVFRTRGHHFMEHFNEVYTRIWTAIVQQDETCVLPTGQQNLSAGAWAILATSAVHVITPARLDAFWDYCRLNAWCAGALTVRYKCGPAGGALAYSCQMLIQDLRAGFPGVDNLHGIGAALEELDAITTARESATTPGEIWEQRWIHSINATYYGCHYVKIDESRIAPAVALAHAIISDINANAPILNSKAIERCVSNSIIASHVTKRTFNEIIKTHIASVAVMAVEQMHGEEAQPAPAAQAQGAAAQR